MKAKKLLLNILSFICVGFSVLAVASCATEGLVFKLSEDHESAIVSDYNGLSSKVVIPSKHGDLSVTSIGGGAFRECDFLQSVKIPNSVTSVGKYAFAGCSSLTSITIPDSVITIGEGAFILCDSLTEVVIGKRVFSIGMYAFFECDSLRTVYYKGTEEQWNSISIDGANGALTDATILYNYKG